jgi:hypothetical protein
MRTEVSMRWPKKSKSRNKTYLGNKYGCRADGSPITENEAKELEKLKKAGLSITEIPDDVQIEILQILDEKAG